MASWTSFSIFAFASVAQNKVNLSVEPGTAEIGETFEVTVTSSEVGTIDFSKVPNEFIQDYAVKQGSSQQTGINGKTSVVYYYTISGAIKTPGNYTFGPVTVTDGNQSFVSNTAIINISPKVKMVAGTVTNQQFRDPAFGLIEVNKTTLYEGEPLLIRAKIYARYKPSHVQNYNPYTLRGAVVKHPMGNNTSVKTLVERYKGEEFYTMDYDKNIVFPSGVGKLTIEPYHLNLHQGYQNFRVFSSKLNITVLPLPANPPKDFIGAVGDFSVAREIAETNFKQGDVIKMKVVVKGTGNLHNITVPQLNLPKGFTIYGDPVITEDYAVGIRGTEGEVTYEFNIEVTASGKTVLPATTITYFDPQAERYITATTDSNSLNIESSPDFEIAQENDNTTDRASELIVQEFNPRSDNGTHHPGTLFGSGMFWGGISIPLASAFLFLLITRRKDDKEERTAAKLDKTRRSSAIQENLEATRKALTSAESDAFYSSLEKTLRSAFAGMSKEERVLSKNEIIDFANAIHPEIKKSVTQLFEACEIAKFSFGLDSDARQEHLKALEHILQQLKHRK